jgi:hypothetical protein
MEMGAWVGAAPIWPDEVTPLLAPLTVTTPLHPSLDEHPSRTVNVLQALLLPGTVYLIWPHVPQKSSLAVRYVVEYSAKYWSPLHAPQPDSTSVDPPQAENWQYG